TATTISTTQINLAWQDNSTGEEGFRIERSINGGSFTQIATVGAGVTSFPNTGLTPSTNFSYRVRAFIGANNSAFSNTANARTLDDNPPPGNRLLVGYLHASFTNGAGVIKLRDVRSDFNFIDIAFGEPAPGSASLIRFSPDPAVGTVDEFKS